MVPDVIFFDLESPCPTAAFSLLETHPQLFLLGISPDNNLVRVWSEQRYREPCLTDLAALIGAGAHASESGGSDQQDRKGGQE